MNLNETDTGLHNDIFGRYLEWALEECRLEVDSGLERLKNVPSMSLAGILEILEGWSYSKQKEYFAGRISRAAKQHKLRAVVTESQQQVMAEADSLREAWLQSPAYGAFIEKSVKPRLDQKILAAAVRAELDPILGNVTQLRSGYFRYFTHFGSFTLFTEVETTKSRLGYHHTLHAGKHSCWPERPDASRVLHIVSFLGWFAIDSITRLDLFENDDIPASAKKVRSYCEYFIQALPWITGGSKILNSCKIEDKDALFGS